MTAERPSSDTIRAALRPHGLFLRGVINFAGGEAAPFLADGRRAASVALIGNVGSSIWPHFRAWQDQTPDCGGSDPLDAWSKAVIGPAANALGATAYFPSDPPWQPFQQWAMRAEGLRASPLGILIHPVYGLWHGYRGALALKHAVDAEAWAEPPGSHPCDNCRERPCLARCPAGAVGAAGFDVPACRDHLRTNTGRKGCMTAGCIAREVCPVGAGYRYCADQLRFHMAALGV
ncbi:ferredoxin [Rhizobium subbaraonis]|uniref:Ferredoxin n=1 Tax=Rhizobium subbaraonis TaxID=908946 RepID=A0A285ULX5_9HYPH|nr:4Fe-4S dicluster domain-containing protein [Rhizobium subbaraonis]SOC42895.1 ferredoxin [Rhizobium subbaraonis]